MGERDERSEAEELFRRLAPKLAAPDVTEGTGFGSMPGLKVGGKIFAMAVKGRLVLKLPRERVDELVESGAGERFEPGQGRVMKEWVTIPTEHRRRWRALAEEALGFVRRPGSSGS